MAFARPTFTDLYSQALNDITSQAVVTSFLRRAILPAVAYAIAGLAWLHYGFLDYIAKQSTPFQSTGEWLYAWGSLRGVNPIPAAPATGTATFTGATGAQVLAGSIVVRGDGASYSVTTAGTLASGTVTVPIQAVVAGAAGNAASGIGLTLSAPASGVNAGGVAATAIAGGADAELDTAYRTRMLQAYAAPPQGGALADYVEWATSVAGCTRAWVAPNSSGAGTVTVYTMFDVSEAAHGGFPQGTNGVATGEPRAAAATGDQLAVANYIYAPNRQPVTALVYSVAPTAYPVNFTIGDLAPVTTAIQAGIAAALASVFLRDAAPFGTTFPVTVPGAVNGRMYPSDFNAAIASVPGIQRFTLVSPSAAVTAGAGAMPSLGTITYI